jgi:tetratricopeptide (TPR) repeat protein
MMHVSTLRQTAIAFCLALMSGINGYAQHNLFDELAEPYFNAFDLNEQHQYLEAHSAIYAVNRQADSILLAAGKTVNDVSSGEYMSFYWPVKKSLGEIAYMLGLQGEMQQVIAQLNSCLALRTSDATAVTDGFRADVAKLLGGYYYLSNQPDSAEQSLNEALTLKPHDHPFIQAVRGDLAQLYYSQGKYAEAVAQLDAVLTLFGRDNTAEAQRQEVMSQRAICLARMGQFAEAVTTINNVITYYRQQADSRRLAEALRKKGKILVLQHDANGGSLAEAVSCYEEYLRLARAFVDENFCGMSASDREQYWMAERPFVTDCYRLENEAPTLLYDVALFSKAVLLQLGRTFQPGMDAQQRRDALQAVRVTWQQVQQGLGRNDAAVEFVAYEKQGQAHLGALVLTKNGNPRFVPVNAVSAITSHNVSLNQNAQISVADLFTLRGGGFGDDAKISAIYNDSILPTLVWPESLTSLLATSTTIYMAVDGIFHRLAPEYLTPASLAEKEIIRLTSTRQLTEARNAISINSMLMCGGVDYTQTQGNATANNDDLAYSIISSNFHGHLAYLQGSRAEVDSISALRSAHTADMLLHADSVSEPALRQLLNQYKALLISTHGSFEQATTLGTDIRPAAADMQLSQSCIYLAGADANLHNPAFDASQNDGIFSAREVATLDLSNLDLAVISACQSGLGFITPDGVFGLQRGLKAAGVRAIVTSLWEVSDQATSLLMRYLFENIEAGMPLHQAFRQARIRLRDEPLIERFGNFTREKRFDQPYFYDAFILIDGI